MRLWSLAKHGPTTNAWRKLSEEIFFLRATAATVSVMVVTQGSEY